MIVRESPTKHKKTMKIVTPNLTTLITSIGVPSGGTPSE